MRKGKAAAAFLVLLAAAGLFLALASALPQSARDSADTPWVGPFLWEDRGMDLAAQGLLVLAGALGVLLVLGVREEGS